jgi:flavin reductase (DIM6/NTAB) family NADH-FMN oxidoreductase RutF
MKQTLKNLVFTPEAVLVIGTYDENGVPNAMNAAWGIQSDYHEITAFLASHKTTDNLRKKGEFTVAFATRKTEKIADYFGVETGRNVNKIEKAGVHEEKAPHVDAPLFEEFPLTLECRVKSLTDDDVLTGEVIDVIADDSVLTDGKVDLGKLEPIIYDISMNKYRVIGEVVGDAFKDGLALK